MKTIYLGVFLTPESRTRLLDLIKPVHEEIHADHLTIKFKPTELEVGNTPLGKRVTLKVEHIAQDEKGQAVLVSGIISANAHPHITISVAKGTKPVYSNELLASDCKKDQPTEALMLEGIIDTFPRTGEQGVHANG